MPITSPTRRSVLAAGLAMPLLAACRIPQAAGALAQRSVRVQAPFDMPAIVVPDFSASRRFPITEFGADEQDQGRTSAAIAAAIAAAHANGAGMVVVPPGTWPTGPVHLRSNVNLHLERGATLLFSARPQDYLPPVMSTWEGLECFNYSPLVYAYDCENVAVSGQGRLQAQLEVWRDWYARPKAHMDALVELYRMADALVPVAQRDMTRGQANLRPQFIQFNRCRHVLVEDIHIVDSPFWTLHPYLCRDVVIRRVDIRAHGHNNDGVDPEMSRNVLIEDCVFDQGDDAVSVKSGRDRDAWRLGTPSRNIVMRNCRVMNGHQMMAIGSELSGGIENVLVENCHVDDSGPRARTAMMNLLYVKTNERRGGYVRNIHMNNVSAPRLAGGILNVETDVLYQWRTLMPTKERRLTPISGIHVSNVEVAEAKFVCQIKGQAELPVRDVRLRRLRVRGLQGAPVRNENVENFDDDAAKGERA